MHLCVLDPLSPQVVPTHPQDRRNTLFLGVAIKDWVQESKSALRRREQGLLPPLGPQDPVNTPFKVLCVSIHSLSQVSAILILCSSVQIIVRTSRIYTALTMC